MILKKLAGVFFAIAFLAAIILFTGTGSQYIPLHVAKIIFICTGAVAMLFNLLSFQHGKSNALFNFLYWAGSLVVFLGLLFFIMKWPYGFNILIAGLVITGISFVVPEEWLARKGGDEDILDGPQ